MVVVVVVVVFSCSCSSLAWLQLIYCKLVSDKCCHQLDSANSRTCVIRPTYSSYGNRCFAAAGVGLRNNLPAHLRQTHISWEQFERLLKTFLFGCWDCGAFWPTVKLGLLPYFTHLLTYLFVVLVLVAVVVVIVDSGITLLEYWVGESAVRNGGFEANAAGKWS